MDTRSKPCGRLMALTAAVLWGISGTLAQFLFSHRGVNTEWLVATRMLISGTILLASAARRRRDIRGIWRDRRDALSLVAFSLFGMLAVQYTYFAAIRYSNAATATILQYLGPTIIAGYVVLRDRKAPTAVEAVAVVCALAGTVSIVSHGDPRSLSISRPALFWGIASAFALAFYAVQPIRLLKKWHPAVVIGWGMFVGGAAMGFLHAPWRVSGDWDAPALAMLVFIILFGSLTAFSLFLTSVSILGATESTVLACAEPLAAAVLAVLYLKVRFGPYDWLGATLILITIVLLSRKEAPADTPAVPTELPSTSPVC